MNRRRSATNQDWVTQQLQGTAPKQSASRADRRLTLERRRRRFWSLWYGSFKPRRRAPPRRVDDSRFHSLDWYSAHLLAIAMSIALLSMADAFLTLQLLANGADELNPVMNAMLYRGVAVFTSVKMGLTGVCILALVVLSRYRFMRLIRVEFVMYAVLAGYLTLIGYELWLLRDTFDPMNL